MDGYDNCGSINGLRFLFKSDKDIMVTLVISNERKKFQMRGNLIHQKDVANQDGEIRNWKKSHTKLQ